MNNSAGHLKPSDLRGRVFSFQAIASSSSCEKPLKSLPLGRYCRSRPLVFSLMPALPGTVRIGEVDFHPGGFGQPVMRCHFPALIVRQRQTPLRLDRDSAHD